jgi:hypothetical protein
VGEHEEGREGEEEREGKRGEGRRDGVLRRVSRRVLWGWGDIPYLYNSLYCTYLCYGKHTRKLGDIKVE